MCVCMHYGTYVAVRPCPGNQVARYARGRNVQKCKVWVCIVIYHAAFYSTALCYTLWSDIHNRAVGDDNDPSPVRPKILLS
jgi:hypothetical protein